MNAALAFAGAFAIVYLVSIMAQTGVQENENTMIANMGSSAGVGGMMMGAYPESGRLPRVIVPDRVDPNYGMLPRDAGYQGPDIHLADVYDRSDPLYHKQATGRGKHPLENVIMVKVVPDVPRRTGVSINGVRLSPYELNNGIYVCYYVMSDDPEDVNAITKVTVNIAEHSFSVTADEYEGFPPPYDVHTSEPILLPGKFTPLGLLYAVPLSDEMVPMLGDPSDKYGGIDFA